MMHMKKTFVLLLSLLLFAACDKEEEKTKPQFSHPVEEEDGKFPFRFPRMC